MEELRKEYNEIKNKNKKIAELCNIIVNTEELNIHNNNIYVLMTEYLEVEKYPIMRELIRNTYNYTDSFVEENNRDLENIKKKNYQIINKLLNNENFVKFCYKAIPKDDSDKTLLNLINNTIQEKIKQINEKKIYDPEEKTVVEDINTDDENNENNEDNEDNYIISKPKEIIIDV